MPHTHAHDGPDGHDAVGRDVARILRVVVAVCAALIVVVGIVLWPSGDTGGNDPLGLEAKPLDAHVTIVEEMPCLGIPTEDCAVVSFELDDGTGGSFETGTDTPIGVGDDIQVTAAPRDDGGTTYSFYEFQRERPLLVLFVLFALAVIALGRWRGLGALAGLAVSLISSCGWPCRRSWTATTRWPSRSSRRSRPSGSCTARGRRRRAERCSPQR